MEKSDQHIERITKYLSGEISEDEKKIFLDWLQSNPENPIHFQTYKAIWLMSGSEDDSTGTIDAYNRFMVNQKQQDISTKLGHRIQTAWGIAATLLILLGFTFTYFLVVQPMRQTTLSTAYVTTHIPTGEKGEVRLPDGTTVWLNAETTLKYPANYSKTNRKVSLSGEAFFDVKNDPKHPFLVETDKLTLRVLGTRFNLKCYEDEDQIETTLIEGSVNILGKQQVKLDENVFLKPNEQAIFFREKQKLIINTIFNETPDAQTNEDQKDASVNTLSKVSNIPPTVQTITSWKENKLIFDNDPFPKMIQKLERWYGVQIEVLDNSLEKNVYSGKFVYNESIEHVLSVLSRATPITYKIKRNVVTINTKQN